jgi:DNA-binding transcriptional LysR family regulator
MPLAAPLNLRQLETFVAAADAGSMTGAGQRLALSQSAVSMAIANLEAALQTQLFVRRRSQGLALTEAGRALLPGARDLLTHADEVRESVDAVGGALSGAMTIGCFRTAAPFLLPPLLESFGAEHPAVELDFLEGPMGEIERALREGRCEIALTYGLEIPADVAFEPLYPAAPYALVGAEHPLAGAGTVELEQLADNPMALMDVPPAAEYVLGVFEERGLTPQIRWRTSSYELVRSLVGRNLAYTLLISRPVSDLSYEGRRLVPLTLAHRPTPTLLGVATLRGVRLTRRARSFVAHCRMQLGRPQRGGEILDT